MINKYFCFSSLAFDIFSIKYFIPTFGAVSHLIFLYRLWKSDPGNLNKIYFNLKGYFLKSIKIKASQKKISKKQMDHH